MNEKECETCIKRKTMYCPNSSECFDTTDKIYYQNRIMALNGNEELVEKNLKLQNNWDELKKWLEEEYKYYQKCSNPNIGYAMGQINRIKSKMQELEGNNE